MTTTRRDEIRLWDLAAGRLLASKDPDYETVEGAAFGRDGCAVVTSHSGWPHRWTVSEQFPDEDGRVLAGEPPLRPLWPDSGRWPALVQVEGEHRWDDLDPDSSLRIADLEMRLSTMVLAAGGRLLVGDDGVGTIQAWDVSGDGPKASLRAAVSATQEPVWSYRYGESAGQQPLRVCDRGRLVLFGWRTGLVVLDAGTGAVVATITVPAGCPTALAGHPAAPVAVLADHDGQIRWWQARTGALVGRVRAHRDRIQGLAVAAGAGLLLSASRDGTAALWRLDDASAVDRFTPAPEPRPGVAVGRADPYELEVAAASFDGRRWLLGGRGGQVHILGWAGADAGLVALRHDQPALAGAFDVAELLDAIGGYRSDGAACVVAAGALSAPGAADELRSSEYPDHAGERVAEALTEAAGAAEHPVAQAALLALAEVDSTSAVAALDSLIEQRKDRASRLLAHLTAEPIPSAERLLEQFPHAAHFTGALILRTLAEDRTAAVAVLHAVLRDFPTGWHDLADYRVMRVVEFLLPDPPDQRFALALLLNSASPRARHVALDLFSSAHRDSRQGGLKSPYGSTWLPRAVHACAVRELSADPDTSRGYGTDPNRYEAAYALWFCYQDDDAPLVARVLATEHDPGVIEMCMGLVDLVFQVDPHYDGGLLDTLHRIATNTGLHPAIRHDAIGVAGCSASRSVEPWLIAALDDNDHRIAAAAARSLLLRDRERFAARIAPLLEDWKDLDGYVFDVMEARRLLAGEDD